MKPRIRQERTARETPVVRSVEKQNKRTHRASCERREAAAAGRLPYKGRRLSAQLKGRKGKAFLTVMAAEKPPASFLSIEAFATIRKFQTVSRIKISCLVTPRSARQRQLNPSWLSLYAPAKRAPTTRPTPYN